jgi:hypothetical protein
MKFTTVSKTLLMGLALLLASSAFAATKGSLELRNPTVVNGTTLKPGEYKFEWDGTGPNVEVTITQGKNVVTKVPAKLVELSTPAPNTAAVVQKNTDGSNSLTGARFEGKKYSLELGEASDSAQSGSAK